MKKLFTAAFTLMLCSSALAGDPVPWSQDFTEYSVTSSWIKAKGNTKTRTITQSSSALRLSQSPTTGSNDYYMWFTGNGFDLEAGKSYRFDIDSYTNATLGNGAKYGFEILLYKKGSSTPAIADAHTTIMKVEQGELLNVYKTFSEYFEPAETGEYYLCLHGYAEYNGRALYWDNFNLVEASQDAPGKSVVTVTADPTGILKAVVDVQLPTQTIRGDALTAISKVMVYRDGGLIKEVANPGIGSTISITDNLAQPGQHHYAAVAYNDKGAGAQSDCFAVIGQDVEEQTWSGNNNYGTAYEAIYTPEGQVKIVWPAKSGVTSYKVTCGTRELTGTPVLDEESNTYSLVDADFVLGTEPRGWQYDVMQVNDDATTTHLGYTNYLCLNNQIPYYPATNIENALDAFTIDRDYRYAWQWTKTNGGYLQGSISDDYSTKVLYRNWLISPGLLLKKDKFYRVKLTGCCDSGVATYTIKAGKGNAREYLDITVAEQMPLVDGDQYLEALRTDEMFLSVPEDGMYFIGLTGDKPEKQYSETMRIKRFDIIEVDGTLPNAPTDATVHYSATGGNDGKISFKVPVKAINGTDVTGLTKVEVYKNGELFSTITEGVTPGVLLEVPITVTAGVQDSYTFMAFNAAGQGEPAMVTVMVLSTPYANDFNNKKSLENYTMINNVGTSTNFSLQNDMARLFTDEYGHDNWIITPPITLQAGMYYMLNFMAKAKENKGEILDVMLGKAPTPEMLTQGIMTGIELDKADNIFMGNREEYFTVEESGQYYLAFHVTGEEGRGNNTEIYIDNLSISAGINGVQPDRGELTVTPAADGSLKAELSYTAATKSLNGNDLNANSTQDVYFYINGEQTPSGRTFKAYPGQKVSIEVEVPEDLPYIFSARTGWQGRVSYQDAFVGINIPSYPKPSEIEIVETQPYGHVQMTWEAPTTDYEGYPLNPDLLVYDIARLDFVTIDNQTQTVETEVASGVKGTTHEFDALEPDADQTMQLYVIRARNIKGKRSSAAVSPYVNVGKPYRMPYQESFSHNGQPGVKTAVFDEQLEGFCHWGIMLDGYESNVKSADGDGYYLAMEALTLDSRGRFYTGKVNLGSGLNPSLTLMVYNHGSADKKDINELEFLIYTYGDRKWHSLGEKRTVDELCNGNPGWNKVTIDLSDYADNVVLCAVEATCNRFTFTSIDNIRVWELPANDLTLQGHNTPVSVTPGREFTVDVIVANNGLNTTKPDSVDMYVDGEKTVSVAGKAIEPGKCETFTMSYSFPAVDLATSHKIVYKAAYVADNDATDNESAEVTVMTVENGLSPVENVKGTADDDMYVTLTWDAPKTDEQSGPITESFETWEPGAASLNGWTSYDNDGRPILGINDGNNNSLVIPGLTAFEPASFAVIDNEEGPLTANSFPAKTGKKFLLSLCPTGSSGSADDWMISPELSGNAQTVKLFARNFPGYRSGIEVLYSEGSMNINDFKSAFVSAVSVDDWAEASIDLPEGAKRFAIRNISYCEESFMLMIDDVTYEPASGDAVALKGYNVYREAECLAQPMTRLYKTEEPMAEGTYTYGITARYTNGESPVVAVEVNVTDTGISTSIADGVHVFGGEGCIHITGAEGMNVSVCDLRGIVICDGVMGSDTRVAAAAGIYVVTVDGKSYKVIVK